MNDWIRARGGYEEDPPRYDEALICTNGHMINGYFGTQPEHNQEHCTKCGQKTIHRCENCKSPIQVALIGDGVMCLPFYHFKAPSFCHSCGKAYPWIQAVLEGAKDLSSELHDLEPDERAKFANSLDDIVTEGAKTNVAAIRVKMYLNKLAPGTYEEIAKLIENLACDSAKKTIFGP